MKSALVVSATCLLLVFAACGGDDGDDPEFISQVNAICADYRPKLELLQPPAEFLDEWGAVGADMADLLEASVNELRLLEPPEGIAGEYDEWLGLRAEMASAMREVQTAGTVYDEQTIDAGLQRVDTAVAEADPLAEELGFAECSPTGVTTGL
ncbi:MAG: hypothetical protein ACRDLZ_09700 [Gaiellaceae bacterium]